MPVIGLDASEPWLYQPVDRWLRYQLPAAIPFSSSAASGRLTPRPFSVLPKWSAVSIFSVGFFCLYVCSRCVYFLEGNIQLLLGMPSKMDVKWLLQIRSFPPAVALSSLDRADRPRYHLNLFCTLVLHSPAKIYLQNSFNLMSNIIQRVYCICQLP